MIENNKEVVFVVKTKSNERKNRNKKIPFNEENEIFEKIKENKPKSSNSHKKKNKEENKFIYINEKGGKEKKKADYYQNKEKKNYANKNNKENSKNRKDFKQNNNNINNNNYDSNFKVVIAYKFFIFNFIIHSLINEFSFKKKIYYSKISLIYLRINKILIIKFLKKKKINLFKKNSRKLMLMKENKKKAVIKIILLFFFNKCIKGNNKMNKKLYYEIENKYVDKYIENNYSFEKKQNKGSNSQKSQMFYKKKEDTCCKYLSQKEVDKGIKEEYLFKVLNKFLLFFFNYYNIKFS